MQTQTKKKRAFDTSKSRVKLVVYDHLNVQKSFYSFFRDDKKGYEHTINAMKKRILADYYGNKFKNATFYNTISDSILVRISPDNVAQTVTKSKVKLVVYDKSNNKKTFFSEELEDSQDVNYILGSMNMRILQYKLGGRYNCAIFYDVEKDEEITRLSPYGRINKE